MGYELALKKAWDGLAQSSGQKQYSLKFLADEYTIDLNKRQLLSLSCNAAVKDHIAVLLLHYLAKKNQGLPGFSGQWSDFKELSKVEGYQPAFRQRVIERLIRKYGGNPEGILTALERLPGEKVNQADLSIKLDVLEGVKVLIELWKADAEFGPEANMLFDKNITEVFCVEDIVVLSEFIASQL